uniref:Protein NATD1 n=1 Tax=Mola mola TaxID=94237 RepID=A0A3Q3VJ13_MOLML
MAWNAVCRVSALNKRRPAAFSSLSSGLTAEHDQQNRRFTVRPDRAPDCAVLRYRFTGDKEVDLMSTFVPETFRGRGVAALLSQAAMDFVVEEKLRARVSCWYIKKYIEEDPLQLLPLVLERLL